MQIDESLVAMHVDKVRALAARAESGEEVAGELEDLVGESTRHFASVAPEGAAALSAAYVSRLNFIAELYDPDQLQYRATLAQAARLAQAA